MKSMKRTLYLLVVSLLFTIVGAYAQTNVPRNGACFYRDVDFRGGFFCAQSGQTMEAVPSGFNDEIRSIRVFGNGQVTVFNDGRFAGASTTFRNDVRDLRMVRMTNDASRNWSERISSVRLDGYGNSPYGNAPYGNSGYGNPQNRDWGYTWGRGRTPAGNGACFFDQPNFRGRSFCVDQGQSLNNVPPGFNDRIQSIQVVGNSEVQMFNDNNFGGVAARTRRDVADLRVWRIPDDPSRNWGGRISSLRVDSPRGGGWNNIGGYGRDGDYNRDRRDDRRDRVGDDDDWNRNNNDSRNQSLVRCSSRPDNRRVYCDTQGSIQDARPVNAGNSCRRNESWGVENGRLWVSNGCSAEFQVRR